MPLIRGALDTESKIEGRLAENILHFARLLRSAGLAVGPGKVLDAITAVKLIGVGAQDDFYTCLFALFVSRREQRELFDQAFHIFWRNPRFMERMMGAMLPTMHIEKEAELEQMSRRLGEAIASGNEKTQENTESDQVEFDAAFTFSQKEVLQEKDFEQMSAQEIEDSKRAIAKLRLPIVDVPTRRFQRSEQGRKVDMREIGRAHV